MFGIKLALALRSGVAPAQTGTAHTYPLAGEEVYPGGVAYDPATGGIVPRGYKE